MQGKYSGRRCSRASGPPPQVWSWAEAGVGRQGRKGGLFLLWLHFLGQGRALELVSRAVGSGHGGGLPLGLLPWVYYPSGSTERDTGWQSGHDTQPQHLTPLGVHLETGCESLVLDPPESCILTCEWGEQCLLGFHKDPIRSAHRTAPVSVSARELLVCACLVTLPVPPPKGLPERGRESTEKQQPGAAGCRGGTRLCFGELWGGWTSLCLGLPVDQRCQPPA